MAHGQDRRPPGSVYSLQDDPGHLIRVGQQAHVALSAYLELTSLTPVQFAILMSLRSAPGIDQRTVGDLSSLDKSTVADTVARLIGKGLIQRRRDTGDGRRNLLFPTAEARRRVDREAERLREVDKRFLAPLGSQRSRQLLRQLRAIGFAHRVDPATLVVREEPANFTVAEASWAFGRLVRICHQVHTTLWTERVGRGLTPVQWEVLFTLERYGQTDQRTLAELVSLDKSTCANVVERLQRRRELVRNRDVSDGRRKLVRIAAAGESLLRAVEEQVDTVRAELLAPLVRGEALSFVTSMRRIASARPATAALD